MRQSITARKYAVVFQKIKSIALSEPFDCDVSACYAPIIGPQGQPVGLAHSWLITVSTPNPLAGQADVAASIPLQGVVPPDAVFEQIATKLWENVVEQKAKALEVPEVKEMPTAVPAAPAAPAEPRKKREREGGGFFPSKPGSDFRAEYVEDMEGDIHP